MYIHRDARLIYLAHPRTASVATGQALSGAGFSRLPPPSDHHSRLEELLDREPIDRADWVVFTAVRNHWDAALSWVFRKYSTRGGQPKSWGIEAFEFALGDSNVWVQDTRLWWLHSDDADLVLRYETLERDLNTVLTGAGLHSISIPQENISTNREYRDYSRYYSDETRDWVAARFSEEIARFGYGF